MNKKNVNLTWIILASTALAGCLGPKNHTPEQATGPRMLLTPEEIDFEGNKYPKGGVVIAQTVYDPNGDAGLKSGDEHDCDGPGFGVRVESTSGDEHYRFAGDGEPCAKPVTLFDGQNPVDTRPPPPSIHVVFQDRLGGKIEPILPRLEMQGGEATTAIDFAATGRNPEARHQQQQEGLDIAETAKLWELKKKSEMVMADKREITRLSTNELIEAHQDKILELQSKLRHLESERTTAQRQNARLSSDVDQLRKVYEAKGTDWEQKDTQKSHEMLQLKQRLADYERRQQELAKDSENKELEYQKRIARLKGDLAVAEKQANEVRKELVLEAAQKIAEAERLAFAARMAEREALEREAARKKQESDVLLNRALSLKNGKTIMVPGLSDLGVGQDMNPMPIALEQLPVNLHVEGKTLSQLMDDVLKQVEPAAGKWRVSWQLAGKNKFLLQETWAMTAEATLGEVLKFIEERIQETHQISLSFQRFDKVKLLVVSDNSDAPGMLEPLK